MTSFAAVAPKTHLPLGMVLQRAGLVSQGQVEVALHDQSYNHNLLLGEILVLRGWIESSTVEFFVEHFHRARNFGNTPLGEHLKQAGLLTEHQIQEVLKEQNHSWIKFGAAAVLRGFIKQQTLDFFKEYFFPKEETVSDYREKTTISGATASGETASGETGQPSESYSSLNAAIEAYFAQDNSNDDCLEEPEDEDDQTQFKWI